VFVTLILWWRAAWALGTASSKTLCYCPCDTKLIAAKAKKLHELQKWLHKREEKPGVLAGQVKLNDGGVSEAIQI
jgi:hypothetical protein